MIALDTNLLVYAHRQDSPWHESPSLVLLAETDSYWQQLREALRKVRIRGAQVHDGRVVALCRPPVWVVCSIATRDKC